MSGPKNVLLIVVDQWRGLMLPKLGADYLKLPNIDRLSAQGVTFRNHFTQAVPCGPARAAPSRCSRWRPGSGTPGTGWSCSPPGSRCFRSRTSRSPPVGPTTPSAR